MELQELMSKVLEKNKNISRDKPYITLGLAEEVGRLSKLVLSGKGASNKYKVKMIIKSILVYSIILCDLEKITLSSIFDEISTETIQA